MRETEVHRDLYIDQELFELEMEHLFANTWVYVGHESQVPKSATTTPRRSARSRVIMVRAAPDSIKVLHNRCPHKGTRLTGETCGNAGRFFRCPYHAWTFRLDGSLAGVPLKSGYDSTGFADGHAARGMTQVRHVHNYRGFVFGKLNDSGTGLRGVLRRGSVQPRQHDRPLAGREARGRGRRAALHARLQLEDAGREPDRHLPSDDRAPILGRHGDRCVEVGASRHQETDGGRDLRALHELLRILPDAWASASGTTATAIPASSHSIHSDYSAVPGYFEQMTAAYGEARAKAILDENRHNTVYFPNVMLKGPIQLLRIFKPIAANRRWSRSWTFRLVGAPDMLLERTVMYNRLINAPTSVVGHDDLEIYERAQAGLASNGNEWVNVQRLYAPGEAEQRNVVTDGTSEWQMRNQFRAWTKFMTMGL